MGNTKYGNYSKVNPKKPISLGVCDYSGFFCRYSDLIQQKEYRGNSLIWTGLLVHKDFADQPNPQGLAKILRADPIPLKNPRPDTSTYTT